MVKSVLPFLMFTGEAEEAMNFYASVVPDSEIVEIARYGPDESGRQGTVKRAAFRLKTQTVRCFDSPPVHAFTFTPSFSFFVECESNEEIQRLHDLLLEGREPLMPLDNYGFSQKFAWINDRYGVAWQLNLT
jgi:predicted 3-demethylubiquinone-9 3-methyltransferase (glyoxalase superfamily)